VSDQPYGTYQYEVYLRGLAGDLPERPFGWRALQRRAREVLDPAAYGYVAGSAGGEETTRANLAAFRHWRLVPRMLRDVVTRDLTTEVLGTTLPVPVLLAPVGVQSIVHPEAEVAVARAAAAVGVPMVLSTASSRSLEEVATVLGDTPRWFQLYWPSDDDFLASLLERAQRAGYSAIVVTLDTFLLGWRPRDLDAAYLPFLHAQGVANYYEDPVFRAGLPGPPDDHPAEAVARFGQFFTNPGVTWNDLAALRERTRLPILLKGILHEDDARAARDHGVDGIVVSNHGGRQVDGAIAALDALPGVADAVGADLAVLFDSGIRTGADAVKALALGARAVLLGRPYVWGLAVGGSAGVEQVLRAFLAELDLTLALCGFRSPAELTRAALVAG
jgi:lactate 2-monooxygenase